MSSLSLLSETRNANISFLFLSSAKKNQCALNSGISYFVQNQKLRFYSFGFSHNCWTSWLRLVIFTLFRDFFSATLWEKILRYQNSLLFFSIFNWASDHHRTLFACQNDEEMVTIRIKDDNNSWIKRTMEHFVIFPLVDFQVDSI